MEIEIVHLLEVCNHIIPHENQHWVSPSFLAKHKSGEARIIEPDKCVGMKWVIIEDIDPEILTSASRQNWETFIREFGTYSGCKFLQ